MSATVALASSTLARPVQIMLHYALSFLRDLAGVTMLVRYAAYLTNIVKPASQATVPRRRHAATAARKVR